MSDTVLCTLLTLCGSGIGAFCGIAVNSRLCNYRIGQLEKKVDKHNELIERMYHAESAITVLDEQVKFTNRRVTELETLPVMQ